MDLTSLLNEMYEAGQKMASPNPNATTPGLTNTEKIPNKDGFKTNGEEPENKCSSPITCYRQTLMVDSDLMDSRETARFLRISMRSLYNHRKKNLIGGEIIWGKLMFRKSELWKVLNEKKLPPQETAQENKY